MTIPIPDAALDGRLAFVGAAAIALVLLASPASAASAHCYSIWRFPHPQPGCFVHAHVAGRAAWAAGGRDGYARERNLVAGLHNRMLRHHSLVVHLETVRLDLATQQVRTDAPDESAIAILRAAMEKN